MIATCILRDIASKKRKEVLSPGTVNNFINSFLDQSKKTFRKDLSIGCVSSELEIPASDSIGPFLFRLTMISNYT